MKHIKRYNESKEDENKPKLVYVVLKFDQGGFVDESFAFMDKMRAADKFIKLVNEEYETEFEPYYEDGERLFTETDENPDFEKAMTYLEENQEKNGISIEILDINLEE